MTQDKNILYNRHKLAGDLDTWEVSSRHGSPSKDFNFVKYNFKLDGVIYRECTYEFITEIQKIQAWGILIDPDWIAREKGFNVLKPGGFGYKPKPKNAI